MIFGCDLPIYLANCACAQIAKYSNSASFKQGTYHFGCAQDTLDLELQLFPSQQAAQIDDLLQMNNVPQIMSKAKSLKK